MGLRVLGLGLTKISCFLVMGFDGFLGLTRDHGAQTFQEVWVRHLGLRAQSSGLSVL